MALQLNASNPPTATGGVNPITPPGGTPSPTLLTAWACINQAMWDARLLGKGDDATSTDLAFYLPRLNQLVNWAQTKGLRLWLQEDVSFTPVQGYNCYQFGAVVSNTVAGTYFIVPKPLRVLECFWQDTSSGARRPLICLSRSEWDFLSTLTSQGPVNSYFADKQQNWLNLWLWLSPDSYSASMGQVHVLLQVQANNFVTLTDTMNFPVEWFIWMRWALAAEISVGQPAAVQQMCRQMADKYFADLDGWDVEDAATQFQPDQRSQYVANNFR